MGAPFVLSDWQLEFYANHYRVRPDATLGQRAPAFVYRRSQIVLPQKAGKAPLTASQICLEGVGPALFGGWAEKGDAYDCRRFGCSCGWYYEYEPGEPMGVPWPTPLIQITAFSEEQTDNIYDALRPMIELGPLRRQIPKTGEQFIRLPNRGRIDVVTSSHRSRLGQRLTFGPQDETGIWTKQSGMVKVAETQRRGLAGMGGRAVETTNAWDPNENSVAQRTAEAGEPDIYRLHPLPPANLSYGNKRERAKIHRHVYKGSPWVDLDAIEAEAAELVKHDPAQAERFFGNRPTAGAGTAFDVDRWSEQADPKTVVEDGALIAVGVDGARFEDAFAIVATVIETGHQFPIGIWEKPDDEREDYEHPFDEIDDAMSAAFDRFEVWRVYCDPPKIDSLIDRWQGRWGDKRVVHWYTNRHKQMAYAVRAFSEALGAAELTHDGDSTYAKHIANSYTQKVNVRDDRGRSMWIIAKERPNSPRKMDAAVAGVLSWEARGDAIADGALETQESVYGERGVVTL